VSIAEKLKGLGWVFLGLLGVAAVFALAGAFIFGAAWVSAKVAPLIVPVFNWTLAICILVLVPACLIPRARGFASVSLLVASFVFGFLLWVWAFIVTLTLWGWFGVIIGLLFAGIGIVPVAFFALLFHADWLGLANLAYMLFALLGARLLAFWIASRVERGEYG
jgi:hypothetical protein